MDLLTDLRYAIRLLRKTPVFTLAAIGTLALGIGANTTIFSLVQSVLLRPLPYAEPDRVVMVWEDAAAYGFPRNTPAPGNFNDWRTLNRSFTDMAATRFAGASITKDGPPEQLLGRAVTANFFAVLGVRPVIGRAFIPGEDLQGPQVVVISHALWQRRYGGDPGIVGRTILMNDVTHEVIGVAPKSFVFRDREIDYWVPLRLPAQQANTRGAHFLNVVARLKPGMSLQAADADMKSIAGRLTEQFPETNRNIGATVVSMREDVLGDTRLELIVLMIAAMSIVLIACANLASLLLSRAASRRGEYAVRLSLGASRPRLARHVVVEALYLALAGGVTGLLIPILTTTFVERLVPTGLHPTIASTFDLRMLAFAGALSITTGLLFSIGPALQSARASTAQALQQHARGSVGGSSRRFRDGLVVLQVAATLVLLFAAGLMLRTLANLDAVTLGFNPDRVLTMQVQLPRPKYADAAKRFAFLDRVIAGVRALPGVQRAAFGSTLPFQSIGNTRGFMIEGRQERVGEIRDVLFRFGTTDYLRTLGAVVAEGRLIDERDGESAPRAVVVNETLARQFLPNQSAVGRRFRFDPDEPWFTIVGVVKNILERGYEQDDKPAAYVSAAQIGDSPMTLIVRVDGDPLSYATAVQQVVRSVDPDQPVRLVRTMTDIIGLTVADRRQQTTLLVAFGTVALLIASLGIYALLAHSVSARSREIGLRIALGARWQAVVAMVMSRGVALIAAGIVLGTVMAWMLTRAMRTLLYGVAASDPLTFGAVLAILGSIGIIACAIPAVRASRVDPIVVLRDQ